MAICERCGNEFERKSGELWKRYCLDCWTEIRNNGNEHVILNLEERIAALEVQVTWLMYQMQKENDSRTHQPG